MKAIIASLLFLSKHGYSAKWDYEELGADWPDSYEMCGSSDQSPINIGTKTAIHDSSVCSKQLDWTVDYSIHSWKIGNNGHSIALQPVMKAAWDPDLEDEASFATVDGEQYTTLSLNENSIGRLPNYFKPEGSENDEFCLHSFHFHWGLMDDAGSEHLVDDVAWPLEVHFVHYSCRHASLGTTLGQFPTFKNVTDKVAAGEDVHELAVVGIFFDVTDHDNPAFDAILNQDVLMNVQYPSDSIYGEVIDDLYLQDIIPEGVFTDGYYSYEGSLTTPPCTNIVRWHVSNSRSYIGKAQMARFRELMADNTTESAPNYRIPQDNTKKLYACMDAPERSVTDSAEEEDKTEVTILWIWAIVVTLLLAATASYCYWKSTHLAKGLAVNKQQRARSRSELAADADGDETEI